MQDLWAALCLVAVLEGLVLFIAPGGWKRAAEQLRALPGEFTASAFVEQTTGVDSVCERAAVCASGGRLIKKKTAADGMTFALARYEEEIRFE